MFRLNGSRGSGRLDIDSDMTLFQNRDHDTFTIVYIGLTYPEALILDLRLKDLTLVLSRVLTFMQILVNVYTM